MSQRQQVLQHLRNVGPITAREASRLYGCDRLSGRILELREMGFPVATQMVKVKKRDGWSRVARYSL